MKHRLKWLCCVGFAWVLGFQTVEAGDAELEKARIPTFGHPGDPSKVTRTVKVEMNDEYRFVPDVFEAKKGEVVAFEVTNVGKVLHQMVFQDNLDGVKAYEDWLNEDPSRLFQKDTYSLMLRPKQKGTFVWEFLREGRFEVVCLVPGHLEHGMRGKLSVLTSKDDPFPPPDRRPMRGVIEVKP